MYTGIYFLIEAIFYSILLIFVYFRKKVFKSKENKVYSALIIVEQCIATKCSLINISVSSKIAKQQFICNFSMIWR